MGPRILQKFEFKNINLLFNDFVSSKYETVLYKLLHTVMSLFSCRCFQILLMKYTLYTLSALVILC